MATKQSKQIGYYVPKEHADNVRRLLTYHSNLKLKVQNLSVERKELSLLYSSMSREKEESDKQLETYARITNLLNSQIDINHEMKNIRDFLRTEYEVVLDYIY